VFLACTGQKRPQKLGSRSSRATKQKHENVKKATNVEDFKKHLQKHRLNLMTRV
jgi:hypothetical protein